MKSYLFWIVIAAVALYFFLWNRKDNDKGETKPDSPKPDKPFNTMDLLKDKVQTLAIEGKGSVNPGLIGGTAASLGPDGQLSTGVIGFVKQPATMTAVSYFTSPANVGLAAGTKSYGNCMCKNGTQCVGKGNCECCDRKIMPLPFQIQMEAQMKRPATLSCMHPICYYNKYWPGCLHCLYSPYGAQNPTSKTTKA